MLAATRDLVVIDVTGDDRATHLDNVTTQQLSGLEPGSVAGLLVLDGKGVPQAVAWAMVDDERIRLVTPPASADHVMDVVAARTFLAQITFERLDLPVTSLGGDDLDEWLDSVGMATEVDRWSANGDVTLARHAFGAEVVGLDLDGVAALAEGRGVTEATGDELALTTGEPRFGTEVAAGRLPEEYGLLPTHVHLAKGCYPGQEPIAHMWMLGRPRRRLATVAVAGPVPDADIVTGVVDGNGLAWVAPDAQVGSEPVEGVVITGFVGGDRDIVGWTPDQTRRRDRTDSAALPSRRP